MSRKNVEDIYPLAPMQQGMLFHTLAATQPGVYFVQHGSTLRGSLDVPAFVRAWQEVVSRHPILRTAFVWERREEPLQVVREKATLPFVELDLRGLGAEEQADRVERFAADDRRRGFDLGKAPLARIALLRLSEDTYRFYMSSHHMLLDGWSMQIVYKEVYAFYDAFAHGRAPALDRARPYGEYIGWLVAQDRSRAEAHWRAELGSFSHATPFGVDRAVPVEGAGTANATLSIGEAESAELAAFARNRQITSSTLLQGAWALLLSRYSGEPDVVFGSVVSGRAAPVPGIEKMVGLFINTLPVRVRVDPDAGVLAWLQDLQVRQAASRDFEHCALVDAQRASGVPRGAPLFESIVVFENYPVEQAALAGMTGIDVGDMRSVERTDYPLTLIGYQRGALALRIAYDAGRFDAASIDRMLGHLAVILGAIAKDPDQRVSAVPMLTEAERETLLVTWNDTARDYPRDLTAHQLFEAQVDRTPFAVAVICGDETIRYRELDRAANRLAHHLVSLGVGPGVLVGLCVTRSIATAVAVLGVLKAGGAYVPLDPTYPRARLAWMLEDSAALVVVTLDELAADLPVGGARVVRLDADRDRLSAEPDDRLAARAKPDDLAYVIYTSGSTGKPKGVMVHHRGLVNYLSHCLSAYPVAEGRGAPVHSSIAFDLTVTSLFAPLVAGKAVTMLPETGEIDVLAGVLADPGGFSLVKLTPAHLEVVSHLLPSSRAAASARALVIGGEALSWEMLALFREHAPETRLINEYGPTETTVGCCIYDAARRGDFRGSVPIGKPIANTRLYVLDPHGQLLPVGVAGELYIGGDGVARGYLNRPDLTGERFVPDPFSAAPGARMYRTGDLARWLPTGDLDFLGRIDHQVKIRGYRIELGEIEASLRQHPAVRDAAVLAREDRPGDKRLVAYVVSAGGPAPSRADLAGFLGERLPEHMVPSAFVALAAMPLTSNGKVDRRALPAPEATAWADRPRVAPRGPVEEALAGIFAEVLKLDPSQVGAHEGFFELGGHSLLATQAISRIRLALGVDLPLRALFDSPSPAELASAIEAAMGTAAAPPIVPLPGSTDLSFAEERFWFLAQLAPDDPSYVIPLLTRFEGDLDPAALERALREVIRRHDILRTTFTSEGGRPARVVHREIAFDLPVIRWPEMTPVERAARARAEAAGEAQRPFDLARGPLLRARLFAIDDRDHLLLVTMHHIVSDAWSLGVMNAEIGALYRAFAAAPGDVVSPLPPLPVQYGDYAAWQRRRLAGDVEERQLAYWRARLGGAPRAIELPTDRRRPGVPTHRGGRVPFAFSEALSRSIKDLSRREGVTLFMTLLAAYDVLLHRWSGQADFSVGSTIANRGRGETEGLVGLFLNTLVLRAEISGDLPFKQLLQQVKATCTGAYAHQDMPFERLVQELDPVRDPSRSPLFQVSFTFQPQPEPIAAEGLRIVREGVENATAKFDITLVTSETPTGIVGMFEYSSDLFDASTIERMARHFETLLEATVKAPATLVRDLDMMPATERRALLAWNDTAADYPRDRCAHEIFEEHARRAPDAVAVRFQGASMTYAELDRRANQLAHHLRRLGVAPGVLVGLSTRRSPAMIAGMLGIMKAGGAYVPLDPTYPRARLELMLADSAVDIVVTEPGAVTALPESSARAVILDEAWESLAAESDAPLGRTSSIGDVAYVIYTSGSTGKPKGVVVEHRGIGNMAAVHRRELGAGPGSRVLQFSSSNFDASVWEFAMALLDGGALVMAPQDALMPGPGLVKLLEEEQVSHVTLPPSALAAMPESDLPALRTIVVAGEPCPPDLVDRWAEGRLFVNAYGPTETTVCATMGACLPGGGKPNIGRPLANVRVHILDPSGNPVPIGVPGEIVVGGVGVARGYLNRPELTAERFLPDRFSSEAGGRLYRTGDLARFLPDGSIDYLGRIDLQVKVRGFRIELGEIEAALGEHPSIRDVAVIAREDSPGDRRLVAYLISEDAAPDAASLRAWLRDRLPEYMVPSAFVSLDRMPVTPSGKVDRAAFQAPEMGADDRPRVPPRGPIEEAMAGIFAEVLKIDPARVGAHDGFFELGGHSLLATRAAARIRASLGVELPLVTLFEEPTVAALAARIEALLAEGTGAAAPPIAPVPRDRPLPLSFGQERLWFLEQLDPGDPTYVVPSAVRLQGKLDVSALERALDAIVARHEVLRTTFAAVAGKPAPVVHASMPVGLAVTRRPDLSPSERAAATRADIVSESNRPFDLARGPLLRAHVIEEGPDDHLLLLTMHHIVSDGWTQGVIASELGQLYATFSAGQPSPLADLPIQYADYAAWQRAFFDSGALDKQLAYWKERLGGASHVIDLPSDRPRPPISSHRGDRRFFSLAPEVASALFDLSRREGATLFMTLLAAFDVLLHRYTGQTSLVVGSPIANRTRGETADLVGFFVNTLAIRADLDPDMPFRDLLRRVREACLGAYAHQDVPFERLVQELVPDRDLSRSPLFQVMFTLQNEGAYDLHLPGLRISRESAVSATSKFDITLAMTETPGSGLAGSLEFATDLFDGPTADRMLGHLQTLLAGIAADPSRSLSALPILTEPERRQLLVEWNDRSAQFPQDRCVHEVFEAQVDRTPDAPAVTFEGKTLTYRELDERSNRLANHLRGLGVGSETMVGLCVDRSLDMMVGILGTLKAGGAYLPLDPEYPKDRLAFMVEDAKIPVLLTQSKHEGTIPGHGARVVRLDADWDTVAASPPTRIPGAARPEGLVYVIYTSGSTGKPKGALICHCNVVRLFEATEHWYRFDASDVWTMFHSYAFDFSVWEIWGALFYGGRVVIVPYWVSRAPDAFYALMRDERVTVLNQTPSAFRQLVRAEESIDEGKRDISLRYVIFGGEALDLNDLRPWWDRHGDKTPQLVNMYGITETTVHVTYRPVGLDDLERPWSSVIGRQIPDLRIYILDPRMLPVPVGVPGEMYVGGAGVARGYLSRPELTDARFLPDPFGDASDREGPIQPGKRLYRTGDVARYLPDGDIEYLGRIDHQVKIRGFRIELGEIEAMLGQHPSIHEVAVLAKQAADGAGEKRLVGYIVCKGAAAPTVAELRAFLKEKLPDYMVPAVYVVLAALPLTASGKVDRRALPEPEEGDRPDLGGDFVAPATRAEEELSRIWQNILRLDKPIGIHDNFFEIGGDSILSIQIVARAQQAGLRLTPRQIFQHPTIAELAEVAGTAAEVSAEQGPVTGPVPLTPIARWWLDQDLTDPHHWNQAYFLEMREPLALPHLERAVSSLLDHHDALRVRVTRTGSGWQEAFAEPGGDTPVRRIDLTGVPDADLGKALSAAAADAQASLDLTKGPAMRAVLFECGVARPQRLFLVIHHLAVDGVSWRVLFDDLWMAYDQAQRGVPVALPAKTTSLRRWAEKLAEHARSAAVEGERPYWLSDLRRRVPRLPGDEPLGDNVEANAETVRASLEPEETESLLRKVPEVYQTQINDILLTAFTQAFSAWTGFPGALVDLEGHGREDLFEDVDLTRTVGWFTTIYPVLIDLAPGVAPGAAIKSVKEQLRAIPARGIGYGLLRYLRDDGVSSDLRALPESEVSFNYLGQFDQALPDDSPFRFARESSGPPHSPRARRRYLIDMTAGVAAGRLEVRWLYSENRHRRATIEALSNRFLAALRALIAHCLSPEAGGYTPSDFQEEGLTQDVVDMLAAMDGLEEES